jgi:HSP20 family protein
MSMTEKNAETKAETKGDVKPEATTAPQRRVGRRLRRRDPFEMFGELQDEMMRLWGQAWPLMPRPLRRMALMPTRWTPTTNVYEKDNTLVVKAELPGVKKEDIDVTLDRGDLVIRGERKAEREVKEENYYRVERSYGSFYRRIPLPFEVNVEQITAEYKDGVLEIRAPRSAQQQPQQQRIPLR